MENCINMEQVNKIALVVAYFGKFPNYLPLWLKSCRYNPTIDFYLFTDQDLKDLPFNVKCIYMSLSEMKDRASNILGFDAALSRPYKCCDYKPLYGLMFMDYLSSYDYWGHCDVDLIFGDLQCFFDQNHLYDYEKFGMLGHLSLFKNIDKVNNAYMIPNHYKDYRQVYSNDKNYAYDELDGISTIMKENGFKVFTKRIFVDIASMYHRYRIIEAYPLDKNAENYPQQTFLWEKGKAYHVFVKNNCVSKEEYIYIHFQKRPNYALTTELIESESFFITNKGFVPTRGCSLNKERILELNSFPGKMYEIVEGKYNLQKRRIKGYLKRKFSK